MRDVALEGHRPNVEQEVRQRFHRHVDGCEALLALAVKMVEPADGWRGRGIDDSVTADSLIAAEAARGLKTYRSVLHACLGGYGPQASMLDRSLFEGMAVAHWVHANPALAAERFDQHSRHNRALWVRRFTDSGFAPYVRDLALPDEQELKKLDKIFGPWGTHLWVGMPLHKLIESISDQWDEPDELQKTFAIVHSANVETMHTTAVSAWQTVLSASDEHLLLESGPSLQLVEQGLFGGLWAYGHILMLVSEHFAIEGRGEVAPLVASAKRRFYPIDPSVHPGRNDPCPCESGDKYKQCHGY